MREALDESSLAQAIRSEGGEQGVRVLVALARLAAEGGELGAKVLAPLAAAEEWLACPCSEHAARCAELASRPVPDDEIPRGRDPSAKAAAAAAHLRRSATLVAASAAQAASIASDPKCVDLVVGLARRGFASFVDARARALAHRRPTPAALAAMASIVLAALREALAAPDRPARPAAPRPVATVSPPRFVVSPDHANRAGHELLERALSRRAALEFVLAQPPRSQIAILEACVERMPWYRVHEEGDRPLGAACYELATELYRRRLPLEERDIASLLRTARHCCGHGLDVREPFDVAVEHMRRHGVSPLLLEAIRQFRGALKGVRSVTAQRLKRRAGIVLLLDAVRERTGCWSDGFRMDLAKLVAAERSRWQALVLAMPLTDAPEPSRAWQRRLEEFADGLGAPRVALRLEAWCPRRGRSAESSAAGRELLKTFRWLSEAVQVGASASR